MARRDMFWDVKRHPATGRSLQRRQRVREAREAIHRGADRRRLLMMEPILRQREQIRLQSPLGDREKLMMQMAQQEKMFGMEQGGREDIARINLQGRGQLQTQGQEASTQAADVAFRRSLLMGDIGRQDAMDLAQFKNQLPQNFRPEVFQGPAGQQQWIGPGQDIPQGYQQTRPSSVSVSIDNKPAPTAERQALVALFDLKRDLQEAMQLYDPRYVGMLDSMLGKFREKTGLGLDPRETSFRQLMSTMIDMAYMKSGKQISPREMLILKERMPDIEISDPAFETKMATFWNMLDSMAKSRQGMLQQSNYIVPTENYNMPQSIQQPQAADPLGIR